MIPRLQLFELEDQRWFPAWIRDLGTDYIHFIEHRFRLHDAMQPLLLELLQQSGQDRVVDLCSGGSGPVRALARDLRAAGHVVHFTLTDLFPNLEAFRAAAAAQPDSVSFVADPVDARAVPAALPGVRTLFNAFHHFRPRDARAILRAAADAGEPIAIFEIAERRLLAILPFFFTPVYLWLATPFVRPFRWRRLLLTYLIPLVPLYCFWDGLVSAFRAYRPSELEALSAGAGGDDYEWRAGVVPLRGMPGRVTWLLGCPR